MAEHDAKTPTDSQIGTHVPTYHSSLGVVHLLGGQTLIGQVHRGPNGPYRIERPYEIFVIPNENSQAPQVTVIKFGAMLALMPELALDIIPLNPGNCLGVVFPSEKLISAYLEGLKRELNPVSKAEVEAMIQPGQTKNGGS